MWDPLDRANKACNGAKKRRDGILPMSNAATTEYVVGVAGNPPELAKALWAGTGVSN